MQRRAGGARRMRLVAAGMASWVLAAATMAGGVVTEMTPDLIQEAIAYGIAANGQANAFDEYKWHGFAGVWLWTPFHRVASAAAVAELQGRRFGMEDVTLEMTRPALIVYSPPFLRGADEVGNVERILVLVREGPGSTRVVQPSAVRRVRGRLQARSGQPRDGFGLNAEFPLT